MTFDQAKIYVDNLNLEKYTGFRDWRLPTLEEAKSLMEPKKNKHGLYIDPVFGKEQDLIWTSDRVSASLAWSVYFLYGSCGGLGDFDAYDVYVRAVR